MGTMIQNKVYCVTGIMKYVYPVMVSKQLGNEQFQDEKSDIPD